jgi:hypothetical protein
MGPRDIRWDSATLALVRAHRRHPPRSRLLVKIAFGKFHQIIKEEVTKLLSEIDISDKELDRLLAMGRKEDMPKEKVVQVIRDNPEEATDAIFSILGADGIKDVMIALANAAGDEELLDYTKTISEDRKEE